MLLSIFDIFYHHPSVITVTLSAPVYLYPDQTKYPFSIRFSLQSALLVLFISHTWYVNIEFFNSYT